jgi:DNA-directed RNA polymerase subunit RPC12/RpoP
MRKDWSALLEGGEAHAAAERGAAAVDLDAGGEIACPACGHRFTISAAAPVCPECGLSLGVGDAVPGEGEEEEAGAARARAPV